MTLNKSCKCGSKKLTTKDIVILGRMEGVTTIILLANCKKCNSTISVAKKGKKSA